MEDGGTTVRIIYDGETVMQFDVVQVVESANRNYVLNHIIECDNTPWLTRWQAEKQAAYEAGQNRVIEILRGNF
jgi:hypothetical protein